jgi:hypothetical protein
MSDSFLKGWTLLFFPTFASVFQQDKGNYPPDFIPCRWKPLPKLTVEAL